ncbi:MAG: fused MFS/spermidine synthase [Pseudomonadota bacterium]
MRTNFFVAAVITIILGFSALYWQSNSPEISYHSENEYGPIWVYDSKGLRCMSFLEPPAHIIQSCMSLSNKKAVLFDYAQMFLSTLFINEDPRKILVIGLGGATVQKALNILTPNAKIHSVEINPAIPTVVEKYFDYEFNFTNKIFVEDGIKYVKNSPHDRYDLILIDAFSIDYIPDGFLTHEFMKNVKEILTENGVVAMNTFVSSKKSDLESQLFKDTFGEYYNLKKANSRVMVAQANGKLPEYQQIAVDSNLWLYRMAEVGINQTALLSLYKGNLKK